MTNNDSNTEKSSESATSSEHQVKPSIALHFIRHAESKNNEVYRDAKFIYRGGTPDFDKDGWVEYVETNRKADPTLSKRGFLQTHHLASYLIPHMENQASQPVRIVVSPMLRTLETIRPTLEGFQKRHSASKKPKVHIIVCAFYFESEGCHHKGRPEEGMTPAQIRELLKDSVQNESDIEFVGFPKVDRGWYLEGTGPETREESEVRAAKFCLWLSEHLDAQLLEPAEDLFDASVQLEGEEHEDEHDKHGARMRRRRTTIMIGHGDFMSLTLKRLVAGYGHCVETQGVPHRSAFTHFNTGISEIEYFGHGRYMIMTTNHTPHIAPSEYTEMRSGGGLKDGWAYLMPADKFVLNAEVDVGFSDELEDHVQEQAVALRSLYMSSKNSQNLIHSTSSGSLVVDERKVEQRKDVQFIVKRGLQVVGVATYSTETGQLTDVAIRPSAAKDRVGEKLMEAVRKHARHLGRSGSMIVHPRSPESRSLFMSMGFSELEQQELMEASIEK